MQLECLKSHQSTVGLACAAPTIDPRLNGMAMAMICSPQEKIGALQKYMLAGMSTWNDA